eukprot:CAMPEP_0119510538 /NCGR_PEP_ID=MMETSP1344-20130328/29489_1 /TAXON_ID=236787 /ORGANISM="Florenciella parvula, Strain CCMP2471" /LENGTH=337 /DNA_ID=CAMNT_0007547475 /DNA_START=27 /DNA_END=1036 /DNA_ORIENTATION=+
MAYGDTSTSSDNDGMMGMGMGMGMGMWLITAIAIALTWSYLGRMFGRSFDLTDKSVLITGASSGIGKALALEYSNKGAKLLLVARRKSELEAVAEECISVGAAGCIPIIADVSTTEGCMIIQKEAEKALGKNNEGALDMVVLNAGISMGASFTSLSKAGEAMDVMRRLMDVNYFGAVGVIDALLPLLQNSPTGVRILAVSSVVGLIAPPTRTGYAASKFALKGFFDALRCELIDSPNGSIVTLAYPGAVRTEINTSRLGLKSEKATALKLTKAMDPKRAASIMVEAAARGQRDVMFSIDGTVGGAIKARVVRILGFFLPSLCDRIVISTTKAISTAA